MEANFWHQKWARGEIGFHRDDVNPHLRKYLEHLKLDSGDTIFVPLCGKTKDIPYLLDSGLHVVGVELSELAIRELFQDLNMTPQVTSLDQFQIYRTNGICIYVGDFFQVDAAMLGNINAIYDRAALVALPETMRKVYTSHLRSITHHAAQLLVTYEYQQNLVDGPPFSVSEKEIHLHYADTYKVSLQERVDVIGGMKGKAASCEVVYLLSPV